MLQVAYAIGVAHPLSVSIFHYGTSQKSEGELLDIVKKNFDLRPGVIVRYNNSFVFFCFLDCCCHTSFSGVINYCFIYDSGIWT